MLEVERRPLHTEPPAAPKLRRRTRWLLGGGALLVVLTALGVLVADQVQERQSFDQAHTALGVTDGRTRTVSEQLRELSRDLRVLQTQVGSDTTALSQDSSALIGAQTSLSAAQAHVSQQASLITSLQSCLVGVEQALNQLAVGKQGAAISALNAVATSCTAAEASSG